MNTTQKQIDHLRKRITEDETGMGQFVVIPMEAGSGKSISTNQIVGQYLDNGGQRNFLIVKRFVTDVKDTVNQINNCSDFEQLALGLTAEDWREYRDRLSDLQDVRVIVTTHQRYKQMCEYPSVAKQFSNRHTLIIDEAVELDIFSFSAEKVHWMEQNLPYTLHEHLLNVCRGLLVTIERLQPKKLIHQIVPCYPRLSEEANMQEFAEKVEANLHTTINRTEVRNFVKSVQVLYSNPCLYQNGQIFSRDESFDHFMLENNIILDANGGMDVRYHNDPRVRVDDMPFLTDHSNWTLTQVKYNSSATSIAHSDNYWERICDLISEEQSAHSRTLLVCHNKHEQELSVVIEQRNIDVSIAHFGDIIGKNHWREFDQVWIVGTPNIPTPVYPLRYAASTNRPLPKTTVQMVRRSGKLGFCDEWLESVKRAHLLCDIYQAVKRINRDNAKAAQVYVVTNQDDIVSDLAKQIKGITCTLPILLNGVTVRNQEQLAYTKADELVEWLIANGKGEYKKKLIREELAIGSPAHLNRYLNHERILQLVNSGRIEIEYQKIRVVQ